MSTLMKREILETPSLLPRTEANCRETAAAVARLFREKNLDRLFVAARGSSENAALYARYCLEIETGCPVTILNPSVYTVYGTFPDMTGGLLVTVSQGGRGVDLRLITEEAARRGIPAVAVTDYPDSPIGRAADFVLPLSVGGEQSMAATKSFTAELRALRVLCDALSGREMIADAARSFQKGLDAGARIPEALDFFSGSAPVYSLGRGRFLPLAREACCKLQETCLVSAFPFSAADFMHGPFALVEKGSRILLFHSKFACAESTASLWRAAKGQGAEVLLITDDKDLAAENGPFTLLVPTESEDESIFAFTALLQLTAALLSEKKGTNPDTSRNLNKYTETV